MLLEVASGTEQKSRGIFHSNTVMIQNYSYSGLIIYQEQIINLIRLMLKEQIKAKLGMCFCRNSSLINCTLDSDISGLTCIDKEYCPYSEEPRSINLTLFVRNLYRLEEHQRTFFIRDIGKSFCAPGWSLYVMDFRFGIHAVYIYCGPIIFMNTNI